MLEFAVPPSNPKEHAQPRGYEGGVQAGSLVKRASQGSADSAARSPLPDAVPVVLEVEALRGEGWCLFGAASVVLEIGFGRGELLLEQALLCPEIEFLGLEISRKRVRKMERRVRRAGIPNLRLLHAPAEYVLERVVGPGRLAACWIHCPDPWPKRRHHARRLIQPRFVALLARALRAGGALRMSTDDPPYAEWMHRVLSAEPKLQSLTAPEPWSWTPPDRRRTGYEEEWIADGRRIHYFAYERTPAPEVESSAEGVTS